MDIVHLAPLLSPSSPEKREKTGGGGGWENAGGVQGSEWREMCFLSLSVPFRTDEKYDLMAEENRKGTGKRTGGEKKGGGDVFRKTFFQTSLYHKRHGF